MITPTPKRGEIWLVEFDPSRGAEIQKTRPALVISTDDVGRLPLRIVVPITDWKAVYASFPWFVRLSPEAANGLSKLSGADTFQVKSVSQDRFVRQLGNASEKQLTEVMQALLLCLGLPPMNES